MVWFAWDGRRVQLTASRDGQKFQNLARRSNLALSVSDPDNPYRYLEIRGLLDTTDDDPEGTFFAQLAERYHSPVHLDASQLERRVRLTVRPTKFYAVGGDRS